MDYTTYQMRQNNIRLIFQCGVFAALSVDIASDARKVEWIQEEMKKLDEELDKLEAEYNAQENTDPFAEIEVK
jgi:uncharacterized coiled-coil protein SlyX